MPYSWAYAKKVLHFVLPGGLFILWNQWTVRRNAALRQQRLQALKQVDQNAPGARRVFTQEAAIEFLVSLGCDRQQVTQGSIPASAISFAIRAIHEHLPKRPLRALHVGNFVGVSLGALTSACRDVHPDSVVVSIDPNLPHRGIHNPLDKVVRVLNHFELQSNSLILTGYSLEKSISNDGNNYRTDYDPLANFASEFSCEQQLAQLGRLAPGIFDLAMIDGNHEGSYLAREIATLDALLRPGGLLILDDVDSNWREIQTVFESLDSTRYERLGTDNRVGILRKR